MKKSMVSKGANRVVDSSFEKIDGAKWQNRVVDSSFEKIGGAKELSGVKART
ncbi:hypothetical protein BSG1_17485 [Bacillus sp. SG-1]|nr:hypothetical protein BSG1_17485 [Bacillus sp. SG-1]